MSAHALHRLIARRASTAFTTREDDVREVRAWLPAVEGGAFDVDAGAVQVGSLSARAADALGLVVQADRSATLAISAAEVPYVLRKGMCVITAPEDEPGTYDASVAEYWSILEIRQTPGVIELDCQKESAATAVALPVLLDGGSPSASADTFYRVLDGGEP